MFCEVRLGSSRCCYWSGIIFCCSKRIRLPAGNRNYVSQYFQSYLSELVLVVPCISSLAVWNQYSILCQIESKLDRNFSVPWFSGHALNLLGIT